ncbi:MAG TPA: GNAT family N-acetyltransferase, partial [Ktedonobacteraceae bacterium]|nr:GNAT family N-acetyltransferase [Ktedonobacteraceae bacterium]
FEADIAKIQVYFDAYACMGIGEEQSVQHYVGYLQDQPVTSSTLLLAGGIAGVYDVSTAPHARGQGLGRAISLAPLLEARRRGYRYAVLQSSPAGHPVYAQLGFTDLYREVNYRWTASTFSL